MYRVVRFVEEGTDRYYKRLGIWSASCHCSNGEKHTENRWKTHKDPVRRTTVRGSKRYLENEKKENCRSTNEKIFRMFCNNICWETVRFAPAILDKTLDRDTARDTRLENATRIYSRGVELNRNASRKSMVRTIFLNENGKHWNCE